MAISSSQTRTSAPRANRGPYADEEQALRMVVDRLAAAWNPRQIWLFGSRAEGRARPDSDFDLLLVFDDNAPADSDESSLYTPLLGLGIGCDVIACLQSEFDAVLADPTNAWQQVWTRAIKVHERPA